MNRIESRSGPLLPNSERQPLALTSFPILSILFILSEKTDLLNCCGFEHCQSQRRFKLSSSYRSRMSGGAAT